MTENKNRVCCLYRVSTDKQVDFNSNHEADLPMQRKACHKFAEAKGWVIVHSLHLLRKTPQADGLHRADRLHYAHSG